MQQELVERARRGDHDAFAVLAAGPIEWSPDGAWVFSADAKGTSILIARSDGTGLVRAIHLSASVWNAGGPIGQFAWQAVAP